MSEITIAHGMTETSPVSFQSSRDDPSSCGLHGRPNPATPRRQDRGHDGKTLPRGESGELCTRLLVMRGYWNEGQDQGRIDADGWMHTGDPRPSTRPAIAASSVASRTW
jgi:fatty-acyl-CoA synthase